MFIPRNIKTRRTNTLDPRHVPDIVSARLDSPACEVLTAAEELTLATRIVTQRAALWRDLIKVIKRLGWHEPPAVAVDVSREADAALLHNLQLLLRVGTAGGGIASRSATALSTLAAAVEGLRDPSLNMLAACARHDVRAFGHGPTLTAHTMKAVKHVQQQLVELGLIVDGDVTQPELVQRRIEPSHVAAVQRLATVSVADAARALAELGDRGADMGAAEAVEAACASLRAARGEVAHDPATPTTPATTPATPRGGGASLSCLMTSSAGELSRAAAAAAARESSESASSSLPSSSSSSSSSSKSEPRKESPILLIPACPVALTRS